MGLDITHIKLVHDVPDDPYDHLRIDSWSIDCNVPLENYSSYIQTINQFSDEEPFEGMFYIEVGYQRKGMTTQFYKDFQADLMLGRIEDVQKIISYVDEDGVEFPQQVKNNLKKTFIENFEFGRSLVIISW